jgi:hypothetical protein
MLWHFSIAQATALNGAGFSDHDLLFTQPNEHAGAAEPGPPPEAASQQRRGAVVPPARRRAAGTEAACAMVSRTAYSQSGYGSWSWVVEHSYESCASAGWGGASELSSLLERSLTLQPGSSQQTDRQPAAAAGTSFWRDSIQRSTAYWSGIVASKQQPARQGSGESGQRRSPDDPHARLAKARSLLADATLVAKLPDRGAKLREQVAELERQVQGQSTSQVAVG